VRTVAACFAANGTITRGIKQKCMQEKKSLLMYLPYLPLETLDSRIVPFYINHPSGQRSKKMISLPSLDNSILADGTGVSKMYRNQDSWVPLRVCRIGSTINVHIIRLGDTKR